MSRVIPRYGWKPSHPDKRDLKADVSGLTVLAEVDPRPHMPLVFDQGQLGSCTANAVSACLEYDWIVDNLSEFKHRHRPSRLFIYYGERMLEGSLGQGDTGAMGRDGFKFAAKYGWVAEHEWPYLIDKFEDVPPANVWEDALANKLTKQYTNVAQDKQSVQLVLSNNQTIAFGFTVYESFEYDANFAATGVMPMPKRGESVLGGHEVLAIGYLQDQPNYVLCRNSWSNNWGMGGYFLMPWNFFLDPDYCSDFRTIVRPLG